MRRIRQHRSRALLHSRHSVARMHLQRGAECPRRGKSEPIANAGYRAYPYDMTLPSKQELRRIWFTVHKWLGLCLALPVMLVFLSGSILVWEASGHDPLHPKRKVGGAAAQPPPIYFAAAPRVLAPGEQVVSLTYPQGRGSVVIMAAGDAGATMQGRMLYYLHPTTGGVLDRASENAGPL